MKSFYAGKSLFTWAGEKVNRTLEKKMLGEPSIFFSELS